jgi:hypothetical protein
MATLALPDLRMGYGGVTVGLLKVPFDVSNEVSWPTVPGLAERRGDRYPTQDLLATTVTTTYRPTHSSRPGPRS